LLKIAGENEEAPIFFSIFVSSYVLASARIQKKKSPKGKKKANFWNDKKFLLQWNERNAAQNLMNLKKKRRLN
jgi:hypothetical protein